MRRLVLIAVCLLVSCVSARPRMSYDLLLTGVSRPADVQQRWGEYRLAPADSSGYRYEDDLVGIVVIPLRSAFHVQVENRSEHSIQLVWDEATYVGPTGQASRISTGETRVVDMNRSQPATVIPARARVVVTAFPNDLVEDGRYGLIQHPIVPDEESSRGLDGSQVRLILPFRVQETVNEYSLVFTIRNIQFPMESADCSYEYYKAGLCRAP